MVLFDVQQRASVAEVTAPLVKYVVWNADMSAVALLSKHAIILCDKNLSASTTIHETIRVKSAAWDDSGVLLFTTLNHLKYCLPNGDCGIIKTIDQPVYITKIAGNIVHALDRYGLQLLAHKCLGVTQEYVTGNLVGGFIGRVLRSI